MNTSMPKKQDVFCKYIISEGTKRRFPTKPTIDNEFDVFEGQSEVFYFPQSDLFEGSLNLNDGTKVIDPWPAHANSRQRSNGQISLTRNSRLNYQTAEQSKLPPIYKPKFLIMLESKINKDKSRYHVPDDKPNKLKLQIYREAFAIFIQNCVYYGPLLAKIKAEYEGHINNLNEELKELQPIKEMLWTVSQECEQRINETRQHENVEIENLKNERKKLMTQLSSLKEESKHLSYEVSFLTRELEKQADDWRTEADGRKLLVTEVNELMSRLKEMESLARAEMDDDLEDPVKLRIAFEQSKLAMKALQLRVTEFEAQYESMVVRSKYEEVRRDLEAQEAETTRLVEEMQSMQSRYDLLQEHCLSLSTYRDVYYIQVTYAQRVFSAKGDPAQKVEYATIMLNRWRRMLADKPWAELTRLVAEEMVKLESGVLPVMVRSSKGRSGKNAGATNDSTPVVQ